MSKKYFPIYLFQPCMTKKDNISGLITRNCAPFQPTSDGCIFDKRGNEVCYCFHNLCNVSAPSHTFNQKIIISLLLPIIIIYISIYQQIIKTVVLYYMMQDLWFLFLFFWQKDAPSPLFFGRYLFRSEASVGEEQKKQQRGFQSIIAKKISFFFHYLPLTLP